MNFSENTNLMPGGQSASPSKVKELENRIDDLQQTVTSVADSVADLSDEVTTTELNATTANITNAVIDNATVGTETATTVTADTVNADNLNATDGSITNLTSDDIEANSVDADNGYFGSVNAQSFTGQGINITGDITASNKLQGKTVQATEKVVTPALESTTTELKGTTTVRGDVYFPENGDSIYGEYLEVKANKVEADTVKVNSLTTETPSITNDLVGFDANGNLIPVDASLDPASLWQNKSGDLTTIVPKNNKKVEATNGATIDGTLTVNGDIIQNGSAYETHAEKLYTKKDIIITRDGAVSALSAGDFTGIQATKYDGTNDGQLVFDKDGEARVGDVGDTQPLLTRDEIANMTNGSLLQWDGTNKKAVCGKSADIIPSDATTSNKLVTNSAVATALAKYPNVKYYNTEQTRSLNCNNIEDRVALVTAAAEYASLNYPAQQLLFIMTSKNSNGDGFQKAISYTSNREWNRIMQNEVWGNWYEIATTDSVNTALAGKQDAFTKNQNTITLSSWGFYLVCVSGAGYDPNYEGVFILYVSDTQILKVHTIYNEGNNLVFTTSGMSITFNGVQTQYIYTTKIGEYRD